MEGPYERRDGFHFCPAHLARVDAVVDSGLRYSRESVYHAIDTERAYQDSKGVASSGAPHQHELEAFALYMDDYMTEFKHQLSRIWTSDGKPPAEALATLRKITALGVAAMEQHGAITREGF
jgi:hypothetical protein